MSDFLKFSKWWLLGVAGFMVLWFIMSSFIVLLGKWTVYLGKVVG